MLEKECLVFLNLLSIGYRSMLKLKDVFGSIDQAIHAPSSDLYAVKGIRKKTLESIIQQRDTGILEKELKLLERTKYKLITIEDICYPELLKQISSPPLVLYVWGTIAPEDTNSIAIVGTRRPTSYGQKTARKIAYELARNNVTIVSGLAKGLDSEAHQGAVEAKGRTIAVLGSGLMRLYPHENKKLARQIAKNGAVISEFPLETTPYRSNFPIRNRIISGLTHGTVVVEATVKSGTLITAGFALEQGRTVFAVPGNIDQASSEGVNILIKQGASLLQSVDDIFREISFLKHTDNIPYKQNQQIPQLNLSSREYEILNLINDKPIHIDEITGQSSLTAPEVSVLILTLEMKQIIIQIPGKFYILNENLMATV